MLGTGRTPRFVKAVDLQPVSPLSQLVADIERSTSARNIWKMFDRVILLGGDITTTQMDALERTWSNRYTQVCRRYGIDS